MKCCQRGKILSGSKSANIPNLSRGCKMQNLLCASTGNFRFFLRPTVDGHLLWKSQSYYCIFQREKWLFLFRANIQLQSDLFSPPSIHPWIHSTQSAAEKSTLIRCVMAAYGSICLRAEPVDGTEHANEAASQTCVFWMQIIWICQASVQCSVSPWPVMYGSHKLVISAPEHKNCKCKMGTWCFS